MANTKWTQSSLWMPLVSSCCYQGIYFILCISLFNYLFNLKGPYIIAFGIVFMRFLCVQKFVSVYLCVSLFYFSSFPAVCFILLWFVCFVSVYLILFFYYSLDNCLFSKERQKGCWTTLGSIRGVTGSRWERGYYT